MKQTTISIYILLTLLFTHLSAHATDTNLFAPCAAVPLASFDANGSTVVGLTSQSNGTVHWVWFDQDGARLDSGSLNVSQNSLAGFALASEVPTNLAGSEGFLLFCLDANSDGDIDNDDFADLAANAFRVKTDSSDVVYVPTLPIFASNLDQNDLTISAWDNSPIASFPVGADSGDNLFLQYFVNGNSGDDERTSIYFFSSAAPPATIDITVFGPSANTTATMLPLMNDRLNVLDLEQQAVFVDADFIGSGVLHWNVNGAGSVFAFSVIESQLFGAAQTLLGNVDIIEDSTLDGWNLVVDSINLSATNLVTNQIFSITASVQNVGNEASLATNLHYLLSTDSTITLGDFELASPSTIGILQPGETTAKNRPVNAPGSAGNYWIGVCIATVLGEANSNDNCSASQPITVVDDSMP